MLHREGPASQTPWSSPSFVLPPCIIYSNFPLKLKRLAAGKQILLPSLVAGGKPSGQCLRQHLVIWVLIPIRSVSHLRVSISSPPSLIFATSYFKETAETTPKILFLSPLVVKLSYFAVFLCHQVCCKCSVILGIPRHCYYSSWDFSSKTHSHDQIERLSSTNSSIS